MRYKFLAALAAFFFATSAYAQNTGTVTSNAFAVGRGAGKTGFASVLCTQAQLAVGQNAAAPICQTLTGDVTINASGVTAIGANKVTLGMMATLAADRLIGNPTGSTATPQAMALLNCATALTYSTSTHTFGCNGSTGSGTVTSVGLANTYGLSISGSPVTTSGNISAGVSLSFLTNSLASNVSLNNTASYFTGPTVAQGSTGTWCANGGVTVADSSSSGQDIYARLTDGTTVFDSKSITTAVGNPNARATMQLSGCITSPAGNIRIEVRDAGATTGTMFFNISGNSKDSTLTVWRIQ